MFNAAALALALLTGLFRLAEIALGEKNARAMLQKNGREFSPWQRIPIFLAYGLWLAALPFITPATTEPDALFLFIFGALQLLRWWSIAHLKNYWTTRIIVVPLAWRIVTGPYRFLKHPIYIALAGEVFALSLAFGQWALGCVAGGITLLWIYLRVRSETRALQMML